MTSPQEAHYGINIIFHIWILFTLLTILFFTFISSIEKQTVTRELNSVIKTNIPKFLNTIHEIEYKYGVPIVWSKVNDISNKIKNKYNGPDPSISEHNNNLMKTAIYISSGLLLIIIASILYFTVYKKFDIHLKYILLDNLFIFVFIGVIELLFFMNVVFKYSPVNNSDMTAQLIKRTKYHVNQQLN